MNKIYFKHQTLTSAILMFFTIIASTANAQWTNIGDLLYYQQNFPNPTIYDGTT